MSKIHIQLSSAIAPMVFTKAEARKIILHAAGLSSYAQFGLGIEAVYRLIDQLGFVQLDTNYVVERAHHHVMAARIPDYEPAWLEELAAEGRIFEYFTSDAGYLPMHDFRYSLSVKNAFVSGGKPLTKAETILMNQVLDRVEREGPLMVGDFEDDRLEASSGWWDWRPAKVALERLYLEGKLVISRTKKFQKVYDLPVNLIPEDTDLSVPTAEEFARYAIKRSLGALGIASAKEMLWRARRVKGNLVKKELENMVAAGELKQVLVEDVKSPALYILADQITEIELSGDAFILSPFDILNVFRHRLKDFFDFDYQIECFVPAAKRKYGYFSLPVLVGDTFVARMDAKADRKRKVLIVHNLHFEAVKLDENMLEKIIVALRAFVQFNQCHDIILNRSNQQVYLKAIQQGLS
jgi:uncharacterized protein YcaQ